MAAVVGELAELLTSVSARDVWFLPAERHVLEFAFFNSLFGALLLVTYASRSTRGSSSSNSNSHSGNLGDLTQQRHQQLSSSSQQQTAQPSDDRQRLSPIAKLLRAVLTLCLCVTIVHKSMGRKIALMAMPCHYATAWYLYSLYETSHRRAERAFNISVYYLFFTLLAIAMPDLKDLVLPGEILNFWTHHVVLLIVPVYLMASRQYNVDLSGMYYLRLAVAYGALFHFDVMTPAALVSGKNVGYMLTPPPKTPFKDQWFRFWHCGVLIACGLIVWLVCRLVYTPSNSHTERRSGSTTVKAARGPDAKQKAIKHS
jgi:hypothetical protein